MVGFWRRGGGRRRRRRRCRRCRGDHGEIEIPRQRRRREGVTTVVEDFVGIFLAQEVDDNGLVVFQDQFEGEGEIDRATKVGDEQLQAVDEIVDDEMLPRFRRHCSRLLDWSKSMKRFEQILTLIPC